MKPVMKHEAILMVSDTTQPKDRYGKYPTKPVTVKARVNFTTTIVKEEDGTVRNTVLEVDLPPTVQLEKGQTIKAKDNLGVWHEATVQLISDALNFAGDRILYRTVKCD